MSVFHLPVREPEPDWFAVRAVQSDEERRKAQHLMAQELAPDEAAEAWLSSSAGSYPGFRPEHTRIAVADGRIVGALRLTTETLQIGEARLKMGGIGWVTTEPEYRHRGVASGLLGETLAYMKAHHYHVSMLFGIPDFYQQFGYVSALVDHAVSLDTVEALCCDNPFTVHRAKPGDIPAMLKLRQRGESEIACTLIRSRSHVTNKWMRFSEWYVLRDGWGKVVGYFLIARHNETLRVEEAAVEEFGLAPAVIGAAARIAEHESRARLRFLLPPPNEIARYLRQFRATFEARRDRNAGGMLAFVDVGETLESMIPEWESRLAASPAADFRTEITLVHDRRYIRIRANRGAIDVANVAGRNKLAVANDDLIHVLTGYRPVGDLLALARTIITQEARAFAEAIFPERYPFVWNFDRF